jgi:hypothetical protein
MWAGVVHLRAHAKIVAATLLCSWKMEKSMTLALPVVSCVNCFQMKLRILHAFLTIGIVLFVKGRAAKTT